MRIKIWASKLLVILIVPFILNSCQTGKIGIFESKGYEIDYDKKLKGKKVALVIGNSSYNESIGSLNSAVNDAESISSKLKEMDFFVIKRTNLTKSRLQDTIEDFAEKVEGAEFALIYYSGHGFAMQGVNYIVPVDGDIKSLADVSRRFVDVASLVKAAKYKNSNRRTLLILDACRNNPFADILRRDGVEEAVLVTAGTKALDIGIKRGEKSSIGLAAWGAEQFTQLAVAFATSPGRVAYDSGRSDNSPYTAALLNRIGEPVSLNDMLSYVREDVLNETNGKQSPWETKGLSSTFLVGERINLEKRVIKTGFILGPPPPP